MNQKGFTLIELLIVVAIIGVIAAVGVVAFNGFISSSKNTACLAEHDNRSKSAQLKISENMLNGQNITFTNIDGNNDTINFSSNTWTLVSGLSSYLKSEYKNPNGPLNGAWDHSTYFVDINQIPTSCTSNQIGYSFMTGINDTRTIKFGTCCKIDQPAIEDRFKW